MKYFRDPMNGLTHFVGFCLAIAGLFLLIEESINPFKSLQLVTFTVFGSAMVLLYLASTLYHWLPVSDKSIKILRRADHSMIFIYIAATYTPICLIALKGGWGWSIFGSVWGLAVAGIVLKMVWLNSPRWLSTCLYLGMGWMVVVGAVPLYHALSAGALFWLVLGGVWYSIGAIIYGLKKPNPYPNVLGFHEIFHICVMAGSFCHFWVMYKYIAAISS